MKPEKPSLGDKLAGKGKRLLGELTGRPDLVLEGEAQDTGMPEEGEAEQRKPGKPPRGR